MIHVDFSLFSPGYMRAFAKFLEECAAIQDAAPKGLGIEIDREPAKFGWVNLSAEVTDVKNASTVTLSPDEYKEEMSAKEDAERIAAKDAYEAAGIPAQEKAMEEAKPVKAKRASPKKAEPVKPAPVAADDKAQDEADEAAEMEAAKPAAKLTLDDVKAAAGPYIDKYGIEFAGVDLGNVMGDAVGIRAIRLLPPDDQDVLAKAIAAIKTACATNPYKRLQVGE